VDSKRAEAFSDGVFAVAITVLVFNLLGTASSSHALTYRLLLHGWPNYFAYAVSFLTIGIMWMNHHGMFARVTRVDRRLLVLNLFLLMGIVAVPFPTALVAEQLKAAAQASGKADVVAATAGGMTAAVAYGIVMIAISICYSVMWMYMASRPEQLGAVQRLQMSRASNIAFSAGLAGYVAGTLIAAFVSAVAGLAIYGLLAIYYLFEHLPDPEDLAGDGGGGAGASRAHAAAGDESPPGDFASS
jgi:uncharacterized membrane protein